MNNNQEEMNVSPYKATGNLNRTISNPSASINDTMNVNIQNVATNNTQVVEPAPVTPPPQQPTSISIAPSTQTNNINNQSIIEEALKKQNATSTVNSSNNKVYVNNENKPKKKKLTLSIGPEFKIALLIIVILLAFVLFILPLISNVH